MPRESNPNQNHKPIGSDGSKSEEVGHGWTLLLKIAEVTQMILDIALNLDLKTGVLPQ